jgi:hypothetical protein
VYAAYVWSGYAAAAAGVRRSRPSMASTINSNDQASLDTLNAGLSPTSVGETHTFTILDVGRAPAAT